MPLALPKTLRNKRVVRDKSAAIDVSEISVLKAVTQGLSILLCKQNHKEIPQSDNFPINIKDHLGPH